MSDVTATPAAVETEMPFDQMSDSEQREHLRKAFFDDFVVDDDEPDSNGGSGGDPDDSSEGGVARNGTNAAGTDDTPEGGAETTPENEENPVEEKEGAKDPASEQQPPAPEEYSVEEFLSLDPLSVDSSRLPGAAKQVHEKYLQFYNSQIAPQLAELKQLRAMRDKLVLGEKPTAEGASRPGSDGDIPIEQFTAAVKAEASRRLGVKELDDFNSEHNIMLSMVASELSAAIQNQKQQREAQTQQIQQAQQSSAAAIQELQKEYGSDYSVIDAWALKELNNLPYALHERVVADLRSGDGARIKGVFKAFADRYKASKAQPPVSTAPAKAVPPAPKLIGGSGNEKAVKASWGVKDFSQAGPKQKAAMLIEAGLLDDD